MQSIESMEKLLLSLFLAFNKLNIVNKKNINTSVFSFESVESAVFINSILKSLDKFRGEHFR